ncbi:L-alanine exporter AlaE [Endozoicomonas arenosclerae]|uniref:L-alanine exporter AlaE n=1 Tax=Endozoicomonas arenosclerae TaxID=1633495 RepID=UPI0007846568|nr:L-alanine exporter AlaE [Endozoicomonas arenosclerae]
MSIKRETLADTFALISFGLVVGMLVEILVAGLSVEQSLQSRLMSIPVNMLIARPYGMYRDWVLGYSRLFGSRALGNTVLDTVAFVSFQIPVYAALVATTGATLEQVITAALGQIGALMFMARPYGMYMQLCRNWFVSGSMKTA